MLADVVTREEKEEATKAAFKVVRSGSLLKIATMIGALMLENAKLLKEVNRLRVLNGEQQRQAKLQEQIDASDKLLQEQCKFLLTSALASSQGK